MNISENRADAVLTVLVVDDDPGARLLAGTALELAGFRVIAAADGASALTRFREHAADCVVLDVVMPGMNGFSVLRKLRHDPLTANVPIIMISGNQQATEQFYLQRCGADDFMKKPFGRDEVCERIGQLVACGRLPARDAATSIADEQRPLSVDALDLIPDVAMPDAGPHEEEQLPESTLSLETAQVAA